MLSGPETIHDGQDDVVAPMRGDDLNSDRHADTAFLGTDQVTNEIIFARGTFGLFSHFHVRSGYNARRHAQQIE